MSINPLADVSCFKKGQRVRYVPTHVVLYSDNPKFDKDCEDGCVSSVNDEYVFVKYDNKAYGKMTTGNEPYTSASTSPEDLVHLIDDRPYRIGELYEKRSNWLYNVSFQKS